MAFKHGNHTVIDLDDGNDTKITSATGQNIVLYPDQNIWIKQGTKLIFEGTVPDDFEAKLQATAVTADRDIILPDEDGTLATQAYVTGAVTGGALSNTDALAEGSTNLYYTQARADARVDAGFTAKSTTDLSEGTNLYYTDARADARVNLQTGANLDLSSKSTSDLSEGTNLYYTDARVDARIASNTGGSLDLSSKTTDDLAEGSNLYYTAARDTAQFNTDLATKSTTNLAEGTNLYYTDARVDARLSGGSVASLTTTGDVIVGGDLTVSGTTTTINTNELNIGDNIITLNSDETGTPSQNAGIEVERGTSANVAIRWNEGTNVWEFSNDGTTYIAFGSSSTFTGTTDGVNEGSTNLYFTNARAISAIEGSAIDMGSNNITTTGKVLYSNVYSNLVDLPAAATYHGMFAHVHATGKGYFAHGGAWVELANHSQLANSSNWDTAFGWGNHASAGYLTGYTVTQGDVDARLSGGTGVTYSSGTISIGQAVATSSDVQFDSFGVGTAASGTTGEIRATNDVTAYYSSDRRLKENVINIDNALEKVKQIRGVEFDWTQEYIDAKGGEDGYFTRKHDVGVIAQEVEEVLPEVVGTREDGIKAVKYDRMVGLLIEAIKEQQSQIDELKQTVKNLTTK